MRVTMDNDRAVSESIGFILILGLVVGSIGLVTLYGYPVLLKEQSTTDVRNMERAMIVVQNDLKSLCYKNVPYKETSLQVSGGTLEVINASSAAAEKFRVSNATGVVAEVKLGRLEYRSDRENYVITLENGAVMKRQADQTGSVMLAEPRWFYDPPTRTFVVYLITFNTTEYMSKTGVGAVKMSLPQKVTLVDDDPGTVTVEYTGGDYSTAWRNYLTSPSVGMAETDPNTYENTTPVDRLVVKVYDVWVHDI